MTKHSSIIKPLEWRLVVGGEHRYYAPTPVGRGSMGIYIDVEDGRYWTDWDKTLANMSDDWINGYATLEEAQADGDADHVAYISRFLV
jgi:hypothetical protein